MLPLFYWVRAPTSSNCRGGVGRGAQDLDFRQFRQEYEPQGAWGTPRSNHGIFTAVPWVLSLLSFRPDTAYIVSHFFGAIVLIALFPFGRLLHLATSRLSYLFRPYQVVIWQRRNSRR